MGMSPPIPIDPVRQIPETVLRQTPMTGHQHLSSSGGAQSGNHPAQSGHSGSGQGFQSPPQQRMQPPHQQPLRQHHQVHPGQYQPMVFQDSNGSSNQQQHGSSNLHSTNTTPDQQQTGQQGHSRNGEPSHHGDGRSEAPHQNTHASQPVQPQHTTHSHDGASTVQHARRDTGHIQQPIPLDTPHMPGQYNAQGQYGGLSHSAPHRSTPLPPQHHLRAATVINQPSRRHVSQPPPTSDQGPSDSLPAPIPASRPNAAESYLDRIEHDPRLQQMLAGAQTRSLHTSQFPHTEDGEMSEKPLPNPFAPQTHDQSMSARGTFGAGQRSTQAGERKSRRRQSLSEGMHPSMLMSTIPDGDRYPQFPGAQPHGGLAHVGHRNVHSRNVSMDSVNPAAYALPP